MPRSERGRIRGNCGDYTTAASRPIEGMRWIARRAHDHCLGRYRGHGRGQAPPLVGPPIARRTSSTSKAEIRRSSSAHCARASATSTTIRGLRPAPPCSSISTARNCSNFRLPCGATLPRSNRMGAQLIDQSCPLPDQPVSRSMQRLHVGLVLALQFDKALGEAE